MRIFVTLTLLLGTVAPLAGCKPFRAKPGTSEQIEIGDQALTQAATLEKELADQRLGLSVAPNTEYNWQKRSKSERWEAKRKLAQYLSLINKVLELDARRGLYVTHKEELLAKRDAATLRQRAIEDFEKIFGENYEPKHKGEDQPDLIPTQNI